jgi:hypothetical protein
MKLGRRHEWDERSKAFPIRTLIPATLRGRSWVCTPRLDQGQNGSCVGFGWSHELAARPVVVGVSNDTAFGLYKLAQTLDQFPGEDYEGTSVLAGAKAVRAQGHMAEFRWAFGVDDVMATISHYGPVVIGSDWMDSMFTPAPSGLLDVSGSLAGGHCYLARGLLMRPSFAKEPVIRIRNSWGPGWAHNGDAFLKASDLESLLLNGGEAVVPVQRS